MALKQKTFGPGRIIGVGTRLDGTYGLGELDPNSPYAIAEAEAMKKQVMIAAAELRHDLQLALRTIRI